MKPHQAHPFWPDATWIAREGILVSLSKPSTKASARTTWRSRMNICRSLITEFGQLFGVRSCAHVL
jgi:hypothetical protein